MMIVDRLLEQRQAEGKPVRFALIGCGFMGQGVVNQVVNSTPGMELVAIANRTPGRGRDAYLDAGVPADKIVSADKPADLDAAIANGKYTITDDPSVVCQAESVDAVVEVTGAVEFGAHVTMDAIAHGKHVVLMNAELDGTAGPILKTYGDRAGVLVTACDGDQPGVQMNLYRFVKGIGVTPLLCGNIKGLQDRYRNPTTQEGFAKQWGQNVHMVTSFADGTKISFEQAIVANATGMTVAKRGMYGHDWDGHIDDAVELYDVDELKELGGIVDYVVKAQPGPGVYVFGTHDDPKQQHYLKLYKLGEGPLYSFYTPYHLCHFEVPTSVARAVLLNDPVMQPAGAPQVEVITRAKTDLKAGTVIDELGGYHSYGECETAAATTAEKLLPIGVAEGCTLKHDVAQDHCITYDDVDVPTDRLIDQLRVEQAQHFA